MAGTRADRESPPKAVPTRCTPRTHWRENGSRFCECRGLAFAKTVARNADAITVYEPDKVLGYVTYAKAVSE